jgi:hypothetical protein
VRRPIGPSNCLSKNSPFAKTEFERQLSGHSQALADAGMNALSPGPCVIIDHAKLPLFDGRKPTFNEFI